MYLSKKIIISFLAGIILTTCVLNSSAQKTKMPYATSKTDRTLIKDIIISQKEMRINQKKILQKLKGIQKSIDSLAE